MRLAPPPFMLPLARFVLLAALAPLGSGQDECCLYFGYGGNVTVKEPALPAPDAALTVECWFRSSARLRNPVHLVSRWSDSAKEEDRGSFFLGLTGTNRVGFGLRNADGKEVILRAGGTWLDGDWHHAAGTWNGTVLVVYLDGKEVGRKEVTEFGPLHTSQRPLLLGPVNSPRARKPIVFDGYLGGVAVHDTTLSAEDLASSMHRKPRESGAGCLAHYPLRTNSPQDSATDESRAGNHGQLSPELAHVGWVHTRGWEGRGEAGPGFDLFSYDLGHVVSKEGRRILVSHEDEESIGVLWQDERSHVISITWIDASLQSHTTHALTAAEDGMLAAGTTDADGNIYYLVIQKAPRERPDDFEVAATLHKAAHEGRPLAERTLDVSKSGLNIFSFSSRVLGAGNMRHSKGVLGLMLPRTMHRSSDGLRHQGAIAVTFSAKDLSQFSHLGQTSGHSMANFLTVSAKGSFLGLDLGDNYPRGVHLHEITKGARSSRLVFTFKTAHSTRPRNDSPVYDEISVDGASFYKWSNDTGVYTESGGLVEDKKAYTIIFATDQSSDGRVLDNSRAFRGCPDARNLAFVSVVKNFQRAPSGSEISDALMADLPRKPKAETGGYYDFGGRWRKQRVVGVHWLTHYGEGEGAHAPQLLPQDDGTNLLLWEKTGQDASLRAMVIDPNGDVITPEFALPFSLHLNRQDRVLRMEGRTYLLASDRKGSAPCVFFLTDES